MDKTKVKMLASLNVFHGILWSSTFLGISVFEVTESKTECQLKNTRAQGVVVVCRK